MPPTTQAEQEIKGSGDANKPLQNHGSTLKHGYKGQVLTLTACPSEAIVHRLDALPLLRVGFYQFQVPGYDTIS